jgi:hypothetical protein
MLLLQLLRRGGVTLTEDLLTRCRSGFEIGFVCGNQVKRSTSLGLTGFFSPENSLSRRGWTLQERELSTRIIHLTWCYIILECREQSLSYHTISRHKTRPLVGCEQKLPVPFFSARRRPDHGPYVYYEIQNFHSLSRRCLCHEPYAHDTKNYFHSL